MPTELLPDPYADARALAAVRHDIEQDFLHGQPSALNALPVDAQAFQIRL